MKSENPFTLPRFIHITSSQEIEDTLMRADYIIERSPEQTVQKLTYFVTGSTQSERLKSIDTIRVTETLRQNPEIPVHDVSIVYAYEAITGEHRIYDVKDRYQMASGQREIDYDARNYLLYDSRQQREPEAILIVE